EQAKIEASNFNRFYGACSAEVLIHHDNVYIKMLRVPGISLNELTALPREAHAAFYEFLSGMAKARIMHDGLCEQNIHYDPTANKFYPIDMG
ncbi:OspG family effector kinase, partial [Pseudomonas lurida]|uniref:OspG family effector kinase n=1 Tax=Pseudomonas lurida TaxID=244566 RepID=UPI0034DA74C7